jgi:radical SAM protein with 4Fe4S-binding SPASM domain
MITIRLENTDEERKGSNIINKLLVFDDYSGVLRGYKIPPVNISIDVDSESKFQIIKKYLTDFPFESKPYRIIHNKPVKGAYSSPLKVFIDINLKCQLTCSFCLSDSSPQHTEEIGINDFEKIANEIGQLGVFMVKLGGGEPLIHSKFWDFVRILRNQHILVSVSSNGFKLTNEDIENIKKYKLKISISIEGTESTHDSVRGIGSYKKAINSLEKLFSSGVEKIYTRTNLMPSNLKDVGHVIELAKGFNGIAKFNYCKPSGRAAIDSRSLISMQDTEEYFNALQVLNKNENGAYVSLDEIMMIDQPVAIDELKYGELICGAGKKSIHISTDLGVSPCVFMGPTYNQGKFLTDGDLIDFWSGSMGTAFNNMRKLEKPTDCKSCSRACAGECPAMRGFSNKGDYLGTDPLCMKSVLERMEELKEVKTN